MARSLLEWMLQFGDKKDKPISKKQGKNQKLSLREKDKLEYRLWELAEEYTHEEDD